MPEVHFRIRWPDGREETCYSPSTAIRDHLEAGRTYPLSDFLTRCVSGLDQAARRVERVHGFRCSRADGQATHVKAQAATFDPEETVKCLSMT